jgi:hypothetical protein
MGFMTPIIIDWIYTYDVGTSFTEDFIYSMLSFWKTGVILEDSLFWKGN